MGKAAAFVCVVVLGIVLVTSADTESSSTTEPAPLEENPLQNTTAPNGNKSKEKIKSTDNDNFEETNEREISNPNSQQKGDVGEGDETESSSNTNSQGTTTKKPRKQKGQRRRGNKKGKGGKNSNNNGSGGTLDVRDLDIEDDFEKGSQGNLPNNGDAEGEENRSMDLIMPSQEEDQGKNKPLERSSSITPNDEDEDLEPSTLVCGSPPDIEGAITPQLKDTEHPVGTAVTYNCPYGYVSRNSIYHVSVCQVNSRTGRPEWGTPEITCIHRSCGDPGYIPNGRRIGNLFTFPNKVEYVCEEGYKLRGLSVRFCQAGGDWSGVLPTCDPIYCIAPANPPNGRVSYSSLEYGTELKYTCNTGYILKKHEPRICSEDGNWSNEEPECIEATCEEPKPPKFGTVKLHGALKVGSLATYSCDPDKRLYGATTTKCLITGQWTFDAPECLRPCTVPLIENGEMGRREIRQTRKGNYMGFTKIPAGENVESQQTLTVRCKNGYTVVQNSTLIPDNHVEVTCSDGAWSKDLQCKKTSCQGQPPSSKNAYPVIGSREHNFTIYYKCTSTYTKKITGNVTCHFGSWIGIPPRCLYYPCYARDLNHPGLVRPPEEYFDSRESFEINCERGYRRAEGINRISCNRGRWETPENPCTFESEESRIIQPNVESQISHGGNPPGTNVESSSPQPVVNTRNPECFCSYAYKDSNVKIQTTHRILAERDAVKLGETVSLECEYPSHRLKWENGFIFYGKAYMTCNICKQWQRNDLPICTRASSDAYIKYDGHFEILPGGIIGMRRGESRQYECRSTWGRPIWDFYERQNVRTESYQLEENGALVYITYLDILQASNQHNGEYQCFLRAPHGSRVGASFLKLQVYDGEDRRISTTEPGVPTGGKVTQPSVNVETSSHQTSEVKPEEDCFCTYEYHHQDVIAQIEEKTLTVGDMIKRGERVSFECKYVAMALTWQNGLRLNGKANMICSTCEKWKKKDVPICLNYERSEAVITFTEDLNILPGGTAIVKKGERNEFHCTSTYTFPEWDYGQRRGVSIRNSEVPVSGKVFYVSVLDIDRSENAPSGEYECYLKNSYGQRIGSSFLHLQTHETDIFCPPIERSGIFTLSYSNQGRINSTVTFFCKDDGKRIEGYNCLTCLPNGTWSGPIPKCVDYVSCPEFTLPQGLTVTYSKDLSVGSIASFECSQQTKDLNGSNFSRCQEDGTWSNPLPFCEDQKCSIHDLAMSVSEEVEPDMSKVTGEYVTLGFEVKLKCADNSVITGDGKALCGQQGKWKIGSFQCVLGCILDLDPSSHLMVDPKKDGYRVGERISLSCPPGEELSSDVEQSMCLSSIWSDTLPDCIEPKKMSGP